MARDGGWEVQSGLCRWLDFGLLSPLGWLMLSGASIRAQCSEVEDGGFVAF